MIVNTIYLVGLALLFSAPLSVMAAIYLTEYAKPGRMVNTINYAVENLAGIPSIIFRPFRIHAVRAAVRFRLVAFKRQPDGCGGHHAHAGADRAGRHTFGAAFLP